MAKALCFGKKNARSGGVKKGGAKAKDGQPTKGMKENTMNLRNFPPEVRLMVFDEAFSGEWDGTVPALLKALRGGNVLYQEAIASFCRTNVFLVSDQNKETIRSMSNVAFSSIKMLKLGRDSFHEREYYSNPNTPENPEVSRLQWSVEENEFKAALTRYYCRTTMGKIFSHASNVTELHFDICKFWYPDVKPAMNAIKVSLLHFPKLKRIIFTQVMDGVCHCIPDYGLHAKRAHRLDHCLGIEGRLWRVGARCYFDEWFWEAEKGKTLKWIEPATAMKTIDSLIDFY